MRGKFTEEQKEKIINLYDSGMNYHYISNIMYKDTGQLVTDDCIRKIVKGVKGQKKKDEGITKCLVLSDLHIPYCRDDILDIVKKHAKEIKYLVLGGDVVDCESISVFDSLGQVDLTDEMIQAHNLLYEIQKLTPGVDRYIIFGNHEVRFEKYLACNGGSLVDLHSNNILEEIVGGFKYFNHQDNTTIGYSELDYTVINDWKVQINDLIVCHPKSFSKIQGRTASNACDYFMNNGFNFESVYVAHTHKQAYVKEFDKHCYEIGCLCKVMPYATSGKLDYTPQNNGYGLAVFYHNKFDANKSQMFHLD